MSHQNDANGIIYITYIYNIYICMCVLTINGGTDISGLSSFGSNRHRNTIIFEKERPYTLKSPLLDC